MGVPSLQERVELVLAEQKLKPIELKAIAGVSKGLVSQWTNGQAKTMGFAAADRIRARYGYAVKWLMKGEGPKLASANGERVEEPGATYLPADEAALLEDYRSLSPNWQLTVRLMCRLAAREQPELSRDINFLMARIFGTQIKPVADKRVEETLRTSRHGFPPGRREPLFRGQEGRGAIPPVRKDKKAAG